MQVTRSAPSKSCQSFLRRRVLQATITCAPHPRSFSAGQASRKKKVVVGFALPGRCSRSSCTEDTRRGGWYQAWDCEKPHLQQRTFTLWVKAERSSTSLPPSHVQLQCHCKPGSSIPQPQPPFLQSYLQRDMRWRSQQFGTEERHIAGRVAPPLS